MTSLGIPRSWKQTWDHSAICSDKRLQTAQIKGSSPILRGEPEMQPPLPSLPADTGLGNLNPGHHMATLQMGSPWTVNQRLPTTAQHTGDTTWTRNLEPESRVSNSFVHNFIKSLSDHQCPLSSTGYKN